MATKQLLFKDDALKALARGIKILAKAVKVTLGPKGRNVVIDKKYGSPLSTKDGVTVAEEIYLKDKFENMGAQLLKEIASKTSNVSGDGTTTAIVLGAAIYLEGLKNVSAGANPVGVKLGIEKAVDTILEALTTLASPINHAHEVKQIATISANNDEQIGAIIADAMAKVGKDGIISVSEAKGIETVLDVVEGMEFDKGYVSPYFITNPENMSSEFENAAVFITDKKLSSAKDIVPFLEKVVSARSSRPLLIIAEDIEGEALATLVLNRLQAGLHLCAVKAPGFGDKRKALLEDIAIITGATVVSEEVGLSVEEATLAVLGSAKQIKITKEKTTIIDGMGSSEKVKARTEQLKGEINNSSTSNYDKQKLEERLAHLVGGVAVINVGAATETEMKEKKARVEDALHATRAAVAEGIVPGGGVALLRAVKALDRLQPQNDEEAVGIAIIRQACYAPAIEIANNCGKQGNLIAEKIFEAEGNFGYNGLTDTFGDLVKEGVIDPVLVTKNALANAASIAALLLATDAMITDKPQPKGKGGAGHGMEGMDGMGGMGMGGMGGMGMM